MTKNVHVGFISIMFDLLLLTAGFAGCTGTTPEQTPATTPAPAATTVAEKEKLLLATTTSLYDTGLLNYLEPKFEEKYNVDLLITSQGTGKAIELAKNGDADVLLVHSPSQEKTFMDGGNGLNRRTFAYNYFLIVGPGNDPAGIKGMTPEEAFKTLMQKGKAGDAKVIFVSRGDNSGTHSAEKTIWKNAKYNYSVDVQKSGTWYVEAGKGMGETLQMASEKGAYTLTDEGTFLAYANNLNVVPIVSEGSSLLNLYSVMTVYNANQPQEKIQMANNFINFLISQETMAEIGRYDMDKDGNKLGKNLFTPMTAGLPPGVTADFTTPATDVKPATATS
jgi:tungstate transport system substrate-binding protein